jgi:membrane fusion protein, multidrug efflux system
MSFRGSKGGIDTSAAAHIQHPAMRRACAVSMALAALVAGCGEGKKEEPPPLTVSYVPAESRDVTVSKTWVGLMDGYQNASVRAQVTGYLLTQSYKEGSLVAKGTELFTIDARPFEAALAQAQADYAEKVAQAQLTQITLERQTDLFTKQVISQQEYDTAAQNAQAAIALAAAAQANVQAAQVNLAYCTITAPFDGIVGKAQAQIGDLVGPGGSESVLTQISQVDPIKAIFSITEREYLYAAKRLNELENRDGGGREVIALTLADGSPYPNMGKFYFINRQVDVSTGTITIETLFDNPDNLLRPGLFARVTAPVRDIPGAVVVPQKALVELQGGFLVSVVGDDGTVRSLPVQIQAPDGDWVAIEGGVSAGDKVVVEGVEKIRPGMKVHAVPYKPQPPKNSPTTPHKPTPSPAPPDKPGGSG